MYCEKCGKKIDDDSSFCTNCGTKIVNKNEEVKNNDNEILFSVKPKFKFLYIGIKICLIFALIGLFIWPYIFTLSYENEKINSIIIGVIIIIAILTMILIKLWYENRKYNFYKTKVIFVNNFINLSQKEVHYKYIREITMTESFYQRLFNLGNIILFTNAETGPNNGIRIANVENPKEVYKQIKELINID